MQNDTAMNSMKALINEKRVTFQRFDKLRDIYLRCFPWELDLESIPDTEVQDYSYWVRDVNLLIEMRNRIVHSGADRFGTGYSQAFKMCCGENLPNYTANAAPPDPIDLLTSLSPRNVERDKLVELHASAVGYACNFVGETLRICSSSVKTTAKKEKFRSLPFFDIPCGGTR